MNLFTHATTDAEIVLIWLSDKSRTTRVSYTSIVAQFFSFMDKPLASVVLEDLQLWHRRLQLTDQPATVANKIRAIKSLFSFCVKVGYLSLNIGSLIKCPLVKDKLSERILSQEECKRLLAAATRERDRALLSMMYVCGLRVSEVCNLTWNDLQPTDGGGKATIFGKGARTRLVLIPESLWRTLRALPKSQTTNAVFVSRTGRPLERTMVFKIFKQCASQAGISPVASCHWLRHSHASHAISAGCNLRLLQVSLGHSKLETTERYLHIDPSEGSSQFIDF